MKILVAYDGSDCADAAIDDLTRAGLPDRAEAVVLTAVDVFIPPKSDAGEANEETFPLYEPHGVKLAHERARRAFEEAESLASKAAENVRKMFPGWQVKAEAQADTPHWAIIFKSEQWKPNLIVVGSQGRSALGRAFLGSVSQKVLYEAQCSVRIARSGKTAEDQSVRLVLAMDGSPDSDAMIDEVASRRWEKAGEVKLVTAVETFQQYSTEPDEQINRVHDLQIVASKRLTEAGLNVETIVTAEDPKSFLVREAEAWKADCIFLGAKGRRFLERFLLGSVSSSVAARAHCSVEVVRRKAD